MVSVSFSFFCLNVLPLLNIKKLLQIGDLKGLFGLLMVNMQMLRAKLKVLDVSYGNGTGMFVGVLCIC